MFMNNTPRSVTLPRIPRIRTTTIHFPETSTATVIWYGKARQGTKRLVPFPEKLQRVGHGFPGICVRALIQPR